MADFSCSAGKILSREETEKLLAYDNAGVARPAAYDDVVFDATGIRGAVYRCKTTEEKKANDAAHAAELARAGRVAGLGREARASAAEAAAANVRDMSSEPINLDPNAVPSGGTSDVPGLQPEAPAKNRR